MFCVKCSNFRVMVERVCLCKSKHRTYLKIHRKYWTLPYLGYLVKCFNKRFSRTLVRQRMKCNTTKSDISSLQKSSMKIHQLTNLYWWNTPLTNLRNWRNPMMSVIMMSGLAGPLIGHKVLTRAGFLPAVCLDCIMYLLQVICWINVKAIWYIPLQRTSMGPGLSVRSREVVCS